MRSLPPELLFYIVDCLIPSDPPIALPASHLITRTLLSLCLVAKIIRPSATRLLLTHCLHIDSSDRLKLLLRSIRDGGQPSPEFATIAQSRSQNSKSPRSKSSGFTKSLFLAPFPEDSIDDRYIALSVCQLFMYIAPFLTRLTIDIHLRSLYPEKDRKHVRSLLRTAFKYLTALEELVSVRDELYLDTVRWTIGSVPEPAVWSLWPRLKRLALYNPALSDPDFVNDIQKCQHLTHLILVRADGLQDRLDAPQASAELHISTHLRRIAIVNTATGHRRPSLSRRTWKDAFLGKCWTASDKPKLQIVRNIVPPIDGEDRVNESQQWVLEAALAGTLWDAPGQLLSVKDARDANGLPQIHWEKTKRPDCEAEIMWVSESE